MRTSTPNRNRPLPLIRAAAWMTLSFVLSSCGTAKENFDATGVFEARNVIVSAEASGRILELSIEDGTPLTAGAVVGRIDAVQLELRRRQLEATRQAVRSRMSDVDIQIAALNQQISSAKLEKERIERLLKADAANQKQLDDLNAQIAVLEKQSAAQRTNIANANQSIIEESNSLEIQIAQVDDQIAKSAITSPLNGTVLTKYAEEGELATPGKALFKAADLRQMTLRAYITADLLSRVKLGDEVSIFTDFGQDGSREYSGKIVWISSEAEFTPKSIQTRDERANLVYAVKIAVDNDGYLKIGMYGRVILTRE